MADPIEMQKARRAYLVLRDRIVAGELGPGDRLPGEPALAAQHGIARVTLRRALDRLASEGLVSRRPGAGTFVRPVRPAKPIVADIANVFSHLAEMGSRTGVRLLAFGYAAPPAPIAEAMRLPAGAHTQRSVRIRLIDGEPFSHLTTHVPEPIGRTYSEAELAERPLLTLLERSGLTLSRAAQSISATLAGPEVADALEVDIGAPLLSMTRTVFDLAGDAVEHLQALYRPDRYAFETDLARTGAADDRRWISANLHPANSDVGPRARTKRSADRRASR